MGDGAPKSLRPDFVSHALSLVTTSILQAVWFQAQNQWLLISAVKTEKLQRDGIAQGHLFGSELDLDEQDRILHVFCVKSMAVSALNISFSTYC